MKKTAAIFSTLLVLLLVLWAGLTFAYSKMVEPFIFQSLAAINEQLDDKGGIAVVEKTSFENGFLSSRVGTAIEGSAILKIARETDRVTLDHRVYHGPIAITPDGIKLCQAYVVTTLDRSDWRDVDTRMVEKVFAGKEPVTIKSWRNIVGSEETEIVVAPFAMNEEDFVIDFQGAKINIEGDSGARVGTANMEVSALEGRAKNGEASVKLAPSSGTIEYDAESHLLGDFDFGNFKAAFTDPEKGTTTMSAQGTSLDFDLKRTNPAYSLLLGESTLVFPGFSMQSGDFEIELSDVTVESETSESKGFLSGSIESRIDSLAGGNLQEMMGGTDLSALFPAKLNLHCTGLDAEAVDQYILRMRELNASQSIRPQTGSTGEPSAEAIRVVDSLFEMAKAGLSFTLDLDFGEMETKTKAELELELGLVGDKKLRELPTGADILNALHASLFLAVDEKMKDHEILGPIVMEARLMGIGSPTADGTIRASLDFKDSALSLEGRPFPIPILQMMQPALNEPIPWNLISQGMAIGMDAAASKQKNPAK